MKKKTGNITCRHCHKDIHTAKLMGISLICPHCGKPADGLSQIINN
jgi:Zn finger protein HypA/HybF involved in hydrogenase expression